MSEATTLMRLIANAVERSDAHVLQEQSRSLTLLLVKKEELLNEILEFILSMMRQTDFQKMSESFRLLKVIEDDIGRLTEQQKERLLHAIESTYEDFVDEASCLLMVEYVATLFADERSLDALLRLLKAKSEIPRALVASGLEHFVGVCSRPELAARAREVLHAMATDSSGLVREEASESLERIGGRH